MAWICRDCGREIPERWPQAKPRFEQEHYYFPHASSDVSAYRTEEVIPPVLTICHTVYRVRVWPDGSIMWVPQNVVNEEGEDIV